MTTVPVRCGLGGMHESFWLWSVIRFFANNKTHTERALCHWTRQRRDTKKVRDNHCWLVTCRRWNVEHLCGCFCECAARSRERLCSARTRAHPHTTPWWLTARVSTHTTVLDNGHCDKQVNTAKQSEGARSGVLLMSAVRPANINKHCATSLAMFKLLARRCGVQNTFVWRRSLSQTVIHQISSGRKTRGRPCSRWNEYISAASAEVTLTQPVSVYLSMIMIMVSAVQLLLTTSVRRGEATVPWSPP